MSPLEQKLDLILRGQHIIMRSSFSPNNPEAQAKHFVALQNDISAWFNDYPAIVAGTVEQPSDTARRDDPPLGSHLD